jgi:hypothetical protein
MSSSSAGVQERGTNRSKLSSKGNDPPFLLLLVPSFPLTFYPQHSPLAVQASNSRWIRSPQVRVPRCRSTDCPRSRTIRPQSTPVRHRTNDPPPPFFSTHTTFRSHPDHSRSFPDLCLPLALPPLFHLMFCVRAAALIAARTHWCLLAASRHMPPLAVQAYRCLTNKSLADLCELQYCHPA